MSSVLLTQTSSTSPSMRRQKLCGLFVRSYTCGSYNCRSYACRYTPYTSTSHTRTPVCMQIYRVRRLSCARTYPAHAFSGATQTYHLHTRCTSCVHTARAHAPSRAGRPTYRALMPRARALSRARRPTMRTACARTRSRIRRPAVHAYLSHSFTLEELLPQLCSRNLRLRHDATCRGRPLHSPIIL